MWSCLDLVQHLSEELVSVGAVSLLLFSSLKKHHRSSWNILLSFQASTQTLSVFCKQVGGYPQSIVSQPIHCLPVIDDTKHTLFTTHTWNTENNTARPLFCLFNMHTNCVNGWSFLTTKKKYIDNLDHIKKSAEMKLSESHTAVMQELDLITW